jgi:aconitate hydratase
MRDVLGTLRQVELSGYGEVAYYSLPALQEKLGIGGVERLPISLRVLLESALRNCGSESVSVEDVLSLAAWETNASRDREVPFLVSRILAPDSSGIPLLADLASMRDAADRLGADPDSINPLVPVDLVVDHSVQVDNFGRQDALDLNMKIEFERNGERYRFLKWAVNAFESVGVVPPGIGICHQVNLEYLAPGVVVRDGVAAFDSLVGADSHTPMVNGIGVVGWGAGGIEVEAAMLGQPMYLLTPDVVGVHLMGELQPGATATDAVLMITEKLRQQSVVGAFVEFFGEGAGSLAATDRATIANMAPEYGATMGFFPVDEKTLEYFTLTGRSAETIDAVKEYFSAQGMFGMPGLGECDYSRVIEIDLADAVPSVAGPRRPQERIALTDLKSAVHTCLNAPTDHEGFTRRYTRSSSGLAGDPVPARPGGQLRDGSIVLAALTSCTNTSNPSVMLAAGLLARNAVKYGLTVPDYIKTSLGPGSRVVTRYLEASGLLSYLERLGFNVVGYGCTTCIGNSGPLDPNVENEIRDGDLVVASALSGNRNFEARIHPSIKMNFLMSPPLVVALALAGRIDIDVQNEPIASGSDGTPVFLKDLWPGQDDIMAVMPFATLPNEYLRLYADVSTGTAAWQAIESPVGRVFPWDASSTYLKAPPFLHDVQRAKEPIRALDCARALVILGDGVTTDHISPGSSISGGSPAGLYLHERGVARSEFNNYIARRANDQVMVRGTFANVRLRNRIVPETEGGFTAHQPDGERMSVFDASLKYRAEGVPLIIVAGDEYGTGSSRDWAAKGTALLGVGAVFASSFERIHRSNLIGMGVLPCQFLGETAESLGLDGTEEYGLEGAGGDMTPGMRLSLVVTRASGQVNVVPVVARLDTEMEVTYYQHGGILPYMLRKLVSQ